MGAIGVILVVKIIPSMQFLNTDIATLFFNFYTKKNNFTKISVQIKNFTYWK